MLSRRASDTPLTDHAVPIVRLLASGAALESRLREDDRGARHYFQSTPPRINGLDAAPEELLSLLRQLHRKGVLCCIETVHPFDPNEYIVRWALPGTAE